MSSGRNVMTRLIRLTLASLVLLAATPSPIAADEINAKKRAAIEQLLELTGALRVGQTRSESLTGQYSRAFKAMRPDLPQALVDAIAEEVNATIKDNMASITEVTVKIYDKYYTLEDVQALIAFYSSDLGKKVLAVRPQVLRDGRAAGESWGKSLAPEIDRRIRERFKAAGMQV